MNQHAKTHAETTAQGLIMNLLRQGKTTEAAAEIRAAQSGRSRVPILDAYWAGALIPAVVAVTAGQRGRDLGARLFAIAARGEMQHPTLLGVDSLTLVIRDAERRPGMEALADIVAGYLAAARSAGAAGTGEAAA